jgi:cbb3-type cytochrome oxidase maturation protein
MTLAYILIFGTIALLSVTVVVVFAWAIRSGQFADFQQGATSIFDEDEPLGEMTDWFPGQHPSETSDIGGAVHRDLPETASNRNTDVDHS